MTIHPTKQLFALRLVRIVQVGISQRELSRRTDPMVSQARISLYEQGLPAPEPDAIALAAALMVDVAQLERRPRQLRRRQVEAQPIAC